MNVSRLTGKFLVAVSPLVLVACAAAAPRPTIVQAPPDAPALTALAPLAAPTISARALAADLAARLETDFVYPEQGRRYAAMLRANAAAGAYDALGGVDLAQRLTQDLQRVAADGHLRVMYQGAGGGPQIIIKRPPDADAGGPPPDRQPKIIRMAPMEQARWLAPGVAFVRFNLFPGDPEAVEAARQFMVTHADAHTIIFDVRTHMGGGLDVIDAILPWLFPEPTRLVSMAARKSVDEAGRSPIGDGPSLRRVQGDPNFVTREHWVTPGTDKRLFNAKVFVLTSGAAASAAEHFALALKAKGRATLIGATTYGANHFGGDQDLGGGFSAFIPVGRAFNPETGADWEGVGIAPDIAVAPESALIEALTRSGVAPEEAARLSAEVPPMLPMTRPRGR